MSGAVPFMNNSQYMSGQSLLQASSAKSARAEPSPAPGPSPAAAASNAAIKRPERPPTSSRWRVIAHGSGSSEPPPETPANIRNALGPHPLMHRRAELRSVREDCFSKLPETAE